MAEKEHPSSETAMAPALHAVVAEDAESASSGNADLVKALDARIGTLERQGRRLRYAVLGAVVFCVALTATGIFPDSTIVKQTLMESEEVKLVDNTGKTRLFLRMYSRVPVLQLLDTAGKPRMSLGLRFDDTPFIDLSDKTGRTRATFEMTEKDEPTLKLFDAGGDVSFSIN
jgi:hypothetical protein